MADPEHLAILQEGPEKWNAWREANRTIYNPDLSGTDILRLNFRNLMKADLSDADLSKADLREAKLSGAFLLSANLSRAKLSDADLSKADLSDAGLHWADLSGATCIHATFTRAVFVNTFLERADLTGAHIYGISAWDLRLKDAIQRDLIITPDYAPTITVDNVEVAQFIYLLAEQ